VRITITIQAEKSNHQWRVPSKVKRELKNPAGKIFLTLAYEAENHWVHANWSGYQTQQSVQQGATTYLEVLANYKCPYLINDNRLVAGPWSQATEWLAQDWIPRAVALGLTHFAHVISPESLARLSAENLRHRIKAALHMQIFEQAEKAQEWLQLAQGKT
jgi:hypothetical protein